MANQWLRLDSEFATDPKVQMMEEADQRRFIMLLCLRCSNGDVTLHDEEVAFQLRISNEEWARTKALLVDRGLITEGNGPAAWDKRQFTSDSSATRVAKHRAKRQAHGLTRQDYIPPATRERVLRMHGGTCVYCDSPNDLTVDHKTPVQRGGTNDEANLQPCCRTCNADKRNMTDVEYRAWNGRVTLQKRPQNTDTDTDTEVIPLPSGRVSASALPSTDLPCPHAELIDLFAKHLPMLPKPRIDLWNGARADALKCRWRWVLHTGKAKDRTDAIAWFDRFFGYVAKSDFLTGRNGKWPGCDLGWLVTAGNFAKVVEGKFDNREAVA